MPWEGQQPPVTDLVAALNYAGGASIAGWFEIDKIDETTYRLTWGTLFGHEEIARSSDLEPMLRCVGKAAYANSVDQMKIALAPLRARAQLMPKFRVEITRVSRITEIGYHEIEARTAQEAEEKAGEMDDPDDMVETDSSIENWECSARPINEK